MTALAPNQGVSRSSVLRTGSLVIPEGKQLLQDVWPLKVLKNQTIKEDRYGGKPVTRITGILQVADEINANGRVYPLPVLREAVEAIQEDISKRSVWGNYDHPADAKIYLDRISHLITKVWMDGRQVIGEAEIIDELPYGHQLKTLLKYGQVGMSSRGIGDMEVREHNGADINYVCPGFRIVTWDAVAEPSVQTAIMHVMESREKLKQPKKNGVLLGQDYYEKRLIEELKRSLS